MPSDLTIQPAAISSDFRVAAKIIPTYLVTLENTAKKGEIYFLATKFDEHSNNCAKFVGFYSNEPSDKIILEYKELIKNTDKSNFVEVLVPWSRIINIRSLVFQHKDTSK